MDSYSRGGVFDGVGIIGGILMGVLGFLLGGPVGALIGVAVGAAAGYFLVKKLA